MNKRTKRVAGILIAAALITDGFTHLYWATGNVWPAHNDRSLSLAVLNMVVSFGPLVTLPLAMLLFAGAAIALARIDCLGRVGELIPEWVLQMGTLAMAVGLLLRGLAGIVWILGIGADTSTTFYWLNLLAYTPACLALAVAAALLAFPARWQKALA
ncbi:DUF3995 domain-containing protein [Ktedonospora formicarum]|uniref:DUF3995 domain-containing protein n=1 Tax=Ktedonospora formicarum TaxID=2778364 RepID=A0A8J3MU55_9CHLR|nr:DUF3995 domain-containing protein [Ktedonospora formicarum]GHO46288.1 hypothetical protein KSX_44510 [Ktedonospora formicarum]